MGRGLFARPTLNTSPRAADRTYVAPRPADLYLFVHVCVDARLRAAESAELACDAVVCTIGVRYRNYHANLARTLLLSPAREQRFFVHVLHKVQDIVVRNLKVRVIRASAVRRCVGESQYHINCPARSCCALTGLPLMRHRWAARDALPTALPRGCSNSNIPSLHRT